MSNDQEQRQQALEKAKALIAEGEHQRLMLRMTRQIEGFAQGDSKALLLDEFVSNVSAIIQESARKGDLERARFLVQKLESYACGEDIALRERAVMALSFCSAHLSPEEDYALLVEVSMIMARWLEMEETYLPVCDTVCRQLQRNGLRMLSEGHWRHIEPVQDILFQIYSGSLEKGNIIRGLASRTLDGLAMSHILEEFALVCQHGLGARRPLAEKMLAHFGRRAVTFLLDKLLVAQQKSDRLYFLQLIPHTGRLPVPVLQEYLHKDLPWYGIRNIVALIAVWGDISHIPLVLPLLKHKDIRVQQQVLDCFDNITSDEKERYLLAALPVVNDDLKPQIVAKIGQLGCPANCMEILLDLLAERDSFAGSAHDELLMQLCLVLRQAPQRRAVTLLQQVLAERIADGKGEKDLVADTVQQALQSLGAQLSPAPQPAVSSDNEAEMEVAFSSDPHAEQLARLKLRDLNSQIEKLLLKKKVAEATRLIADHAVAAAKNKDFVTAEILQERILAVNPDALLEVIRVTELIDNEKMNAISSHELEIWRELHTCLGDEVFSALYQSQQSQEYQPGVVIIRQGAAKTSLYFVAEGQVNVSYQQGQQEIFLKSLKAGDIVGVVPFFDDSIWTVSLTAVTAVQIRVLERASWYQLKQRYPGIESQLAGFCRRSDNIADLLHASGQSRRQEQRNHAEQVVHSNLLDAHGQATNQKFRGQLEDIAHGGLALLIRLSKKENAHLLLGQCLESSLQTGENQVIQIKGCIVSVSLQDVFNSDYLVHVRFDQPITDEMMSRVVRQGIPKA